MVVKRTIDVIGSPGTGAFLATVLAIALAVRLTSKGPVFFRQQRVGQYGQCFTFLKFRSMYVNNDHIVHQKFVTELIANDAKSKSSGKKERTSSSSQNDTRITRVGEFLRRTSLDELPQLLNVLKGEMSLVGPRPAIPYELAAYQTWHRRRVLGNQARHHRSVAGYGPKPGQIRRHGPDGSALCHGVVAMAGFEDTLAHAACSHSRFRCVLRSHGPAACTFQTARSDLHRGWSLIFKPILNGIDRHSAGTAAES